MALDFIAVWQRCDANEKAQATRRARRLGYGQPAECADRLNHLPGMKRYGEILFVTSLPLSPKGPAGRWKARKPGDLHAADTSPDMHCNRHAAFRQKRQISGLQRRRIPGWDAIVDEKQLIRQRASDESDA